MPEPISWEIRENAYDAYVTDGLTYDQVAKLSGVSASQLKRWGQDDGWADARKEYRQALQSIKRNTVKLRAGLLKKAMDSKDAQDVYAFAALERIEASRTTGTVLEAPPDLSKIRDIKTPKETVEALQEMIDLKINKGLANPEVMKPGWVKEIESTINLVGKMAQKYNPEGQDKPKAITAQRLKEIKEAAGL